MPSFFKPPPDPTDANQWYLIYDNLQDLIAQYDSLANPIGIFRHPGKGKLLLPPNAPHLLPRHLEGPCKLNPTKDGIILAGSPIGSDEFTLSTVTTLIDTNVKSRLDTINRVAELNSQLGISLIGSMANNMLNYITSTTPTSIIAPAITSFDRLITDARLTCITPPTALKPLTNSHRLSRSVSLQSLKCKDGGTGHIRLHYRAPAAYLSSALSALHNPLISYNYSSLSHHLQSNYQWICKALDLPSIPPNHPLSTVLPTDPNSLNSHDLALSLTTNRNRKVQATITLSLLSDLRKRLRSLCSTPLPSIDLNLFDCTHILATTSRSQMPRVFTASLWHKHNRIPSQHFTAWYRYHYNLPQLLQSDAPIIIDGTAYSPCLATKQCVDNNCYINATATHTVACNGFKASRYSIHNNLRNHTHYIAKEAGATSSVEPDSSTILLREFTSEQMRKLFPKQQSQSNPALQIAYDLLQPNLQPHQISQLRLDLASAISSCDDNQGRRIDVAIHTPLPADYWVDVSAIHATKSSTITSAASWFNAEHACEKDAATLNTPNNMLALPSKPIADAIKLKQTTYSLLHKLAILQHAKGARPTIPRFMSCIMSHEGEWSPDFFDFFEDMTRLAKAHACKDTLMGDTPSKLAASFRQNAKDRLVCVMIAGLGKGLLLAGLPSLSAVLGGH
jgi:hypothetical protein